MENPSLKEGFLKIGLTYSIKKRIKSASNTSLPDDYEVLSYYEVKDMLKAENLVFDLLDKYRYKKGKEFFTCPYVMADKMCIIAQTKINNLVNKKIGKTYYSDHAFEQKINSDMNIEEYVFED